MCLTQAHSTTAAGAKGELTMPFTRPLIGGFLQARYPTLMAGFTAAGVNGTIDSDHSDNIWAVGDIFKSPLRNPEFAADVTTASRETMTSIAVWPTSHGQTHQRTPTPKLPYSEINRSTVFHFTGHDFRGWLLARDQAAGLVRSCRGRVLVCTFPGPQ